jgi:hypothetical protein
MYARLAVERRGGQARALIWHLPGGREFGGADHGVFVPGALGASAAVLGHVITAVEDFLDRVVWP